MSRFAFLVFLLGAFVASEGGVNIPQSEVVLTSLSNPVYPRLANQARVAGDVELKVSVRADGTVKSVEVISGPPMLQQAALDSAQHSKFDCQQCREDVISYRLVYTFETIPPQYGPECEVKLDAAYPQVTQSQNHVTVIDQSIGFCDPAVSIKRVRSVKCLYLWKCGHE